MKLKKITFEQKHWNLQILITFSYKNFSERSVEVIITCNKRKRIILEHIFLLLLS